MKIKKLIVLYLFTLSLFPITAHADSSGGSRSSHRFGIYAGLLGDPFPTLCGVNVAFNATDFARIVAGYGSISATFPDSSGAEAKLTATTLGGGLRLFVPGWSLSPVAGISYSQVTVTATGDASGHTVGGFSGSSGNIYSSFGLDWQTHYGLNLGVGYSISFSGGGGLPFINIGWFF